MRRLVTAVFCLGLLTIGLAENARATALPFTGTLEIRFPIENAPSFTIPGSGVAEVGVDGDNHLASVVLPAGAFGAFNTSIPLTSLAETRSVIFTISQNLTGSFTGLSGTPSGGGTMGISGVAKICLIFAACLYSNVTVPLTPTGGTGFGVGGTQTVPGALAVTMQHNPWTIGPPATVTVHTPNSTLSVPILPGGFAHGPATGGASSAAQLSGVVQLVTVSKTYTSLFSSSPELPFTGVLTLHFVPEPGTLLLLAFGVAGLAAAGRRRPLQ